jgi:hypothetical protein
MKSIISILAISILSLSANAAKISLKCEQGVGNVDQPKTFLTLDGDIKNTSKRGELSDADKSLLLLSVNNGSQLIRLKNSEYSISVTDEKLIDGGYMVGTVMRISVLSDIAKDIVFKITKTEDSADSIIQVTGKSRFLGRAIQVDSGVCYGQSAF